MSERKPEVPLDPLSTTPEVTKAAALAMLRDPTLMDRVSDDLEKLGIAGEQVLAATIYLVGTSRLLEKPLAVIIQGVTSSGKSYVPDTVAKLFPPEAVIRAHKITPEALSHMPRGSLIHRFVIGGERSRRQDDETADATRALREMISDGRLTKLITVRKGGTFETTQIDQPGPIAYVESTTLQNIRDEDRNRCIILQTDETPDQTRRIISSLASRKAGPETSDVVEIVARHWAGQRLLRRCRVVIPFAGRLAELFPSERTDARRAFGHLLSMIEAVALLHQYQRTEEPADGAVIAATAADFEIARGLVAEPFARSMGNGLSNAARRFGERLKAKFGRAPFDTREITKTEKVIGDVQTIRQYVRELAEAGFLEQLVPPQGPKPALYQFAADLPDEATAAGLPTVEEVCGAVVESAPPLCDKSQPVAAA